jgi:hypothetical protein
MIPSIAKKTSKKTQVTAPIKLTFEPDFERIPIVPSYSEKMKVLILNPNFETCLRNNFIECINKLNKFELDKEELKIEFDSFYRESFLNPYIEKLKSRFNKEVLEFIPEQITS